MPHYKKAPITEAIIDIQVQPAPDVKAVDLLDFQLGKEERFPDRKEIAKGTGRIQFGSEISSSVMSQHTGYRFRSFDKLETVSLTTSGFTLSRLPPYESWEPFRDHAKEMWTAYRHDTHPISIQRLAVRYVNRIELPAVPVELKDYLRTTPEVSEDTPCGILAGYFMQLQIPQTDILSMVTITQAIVPAATQSAIGVVLDIDIFRDNELPQKEQDIWAFFETLRVRKNEVFESCITDLARRLFQ